MKKTTLLLLFSFLNFFAFYLYSEKITSRLHFSIDDAPLFLLIEDIESQTLFENITYSNPTTIVSIEELLLQDHEEQLLSLYLPQNKKDDSFNTLAFDNLLLQDYDESLLSMHFPSQEIKINEIALNDPIEPSHDTTTTTTPSIVFPENEEPLVEEEQVFYPYEYTYAPFAPARIVQISHTEGKFLGNTLGYTTGSLFIENNTISSSIRPFFNSNLHVFNQGSIALNAGIGSRFYLSNSSLGIGFNVFADYQNYIQDFGQAGIGIELVGPNFNFSINGYHPIGPKSRAFSNFTCVYEGTPYKITTTRSKRAFAGSDATIRGRLLSFNRGQFDITGGIGPYILNKGHGSYIVGGEIGLGVWYLGMIRAEASASYDSYYKLGAQTVVSIEIPIFGGSNNLRDYRNQPVYRKSIITLSKTRCKFNANWPWKDYCK